MSRVGKYPVPVPSGVQVALQGRTVVAKGRNGELKLDLTDEVDVEIADNQVAVKPRRDDRRSRTMWGTTRSLINSMVTGPTFENLHGDPRYARLRERLGLRPQP